MIDWDKMEYYTKAFKSLLRESKDCESFLREVPYRRAAPLLLGKALEGEGSTLATPQADEAWFVMTDAGVDREGDIIVSSGVDVDQFSNYGSILWGHRADEPRFVLGSPSEVVKEDTRILVRAKFFGPEANPDAERVLRMIQAGGVKAMSVGIRIMEYTEAKDRQGFMPLNILRSELIETSVTPVPMNPRAVLLAAGEPGSEEAVETARLFEATADTPEELGASAETLGISEDEIKALVHQTVKDLLGDYTTYSLPVGAGDSALAALSYFARQAAQ